MPPSPCGSGQCHQLFYGRRPRALLGLTRCGAPILGARLPRRSTRNTLLGSLAGRRSPGDSVGHRLPWRHGTCPRALYPLRQELIELAIAIVNKIDLVHIILAVGVDVDDVRVMPARGVLMAPEPCLCHGYLGAVRHGILQSCQRPTPLHKVKASALVATVLHECHDVGSLAVHLADLKGSSKRTVRDIKSVGTCAVLEKPRSGRLGWLRTTLYCSVPSRKYPRPQGYTVGDASRHFSMPVQVKAMGSNSTPNSLR